MKHPVLIRRIQHLTDARYFAAMGVEWMSMELADDQATFDRWHAISDWVEGVKMLAEPVDASEELWAKIFIDAKPDGILITKNTLLEIPEEVEPFCLVGQGEEFVPDQCEYIILPYDQSGIWQSVAQQADPEKTFLASDWNRNTLDEAVSAGYSGGICFSGGKEDVTGVRDYGEMDEMMGILE